MWWCRHSYPQTPQAYFLVPGIVGVSIAKDIKKKKSFLFYPRPRLDLENTFLM